jgi:PAS domain S-box-containing protein
MNEGLASGQKTLQEENAELRARLEDAEETLRAIRAGEVDALVVESDAGPQVFILESSDAEANRFRSDILSKVSDAVIAIDRDHRVVYINSAAERQYGIASSHALGHPLSEIYQYRWIHPDDEQASRKALRETGHWRGKNIQIKRDGTVIHVESSVSCLFAPDGAPSGLLGVIRDITAQNAAAEAIKESERRFREMIDSLPAAIYTTDAEGRLTHFNPAAVEFSGRTPELGTDHWCVSWKLYHADGTPMPHDECPMATALREGRIDHDLEAIAERPDGTRRWFTPYPTPLRDAEGRLVGGINMLMDITKRKAAEEALRENQVRLQLTLESARIGDWDLDLTTDRASRSLLHDQIFGYREPVAHWGFKQFLHHVHRDDRDEIERQFREAVTGNKDWNIECRIVWPNGSIHWIAAHGSIFHTSQGQPNRMLGVVFDITGRKQAEEILRQNEALFSTIIDQAPGGVYVVDDRFRLMRANSLAQPTFAAAEPVIGRDFAEIMRILWGKEVGKKLSDIFWHTLETGESYVSPRFTEHREDLGEEKSYDWEIRRITLPNGRHGVVCYFSDVTDQWKLEEALRASEQRATDIVQSISDGFITMDLDWRITYLSERGAEMLSPLRKTSSNVLGKNHWEEFPDAVGGPIEENYRRAMRDKVPVQFEVFYTPLNAWLEIRAYPSSSGLSIYFLDITERKNAEKALAEQAAALLTADRSKDEFLAMLAHELRNPLAPMRNATEILRTPTAGPGERDHAQELIARQIENMSRMIDDLLDVSRITEGKIELHKQPTELHAILSAAADAVRPSCAANNQKLTVSFPREPVYLDGDATRLEQIFGNLLGNACKYSGVGSDISLSAELERPGEVLIRVSDNGIGIDPELLPRIFDLFVQSSRALDRSHGGLGIGLTVAHRLVVLHGGSIEATSGGPGRGTNFSIRFPVIPPPRVLPAKTISGPVGNRTLRILIVDDNRDSAETMATLQELHGHETRVAHTGPEAVSTAADFLPHVVLLDIGLPEMDGFEVARRIRAMRAMEDAFLIALTGYGTAKDREAAKEAGFNEHLAKPADLAQLQEWFRTRL